MARTNTEVAYAAVHAIREYWRKHPDTNKFHAPKIQMDGAGVISSNMVNGYPPPVPVTGRSR